MGAPLIFPIGRPITRHHPSPFPGVLQPPQRTLTLTSSPDKHPPFIHSLRPEDWSFLFSLDSTRLDLISPFRHGHVFARPALSAHAPCQVALPRLDQGLPAKGSYRSIRFLSSLQPATSTHNTRPHTTRDTPPTTTRQPTHARTPLPCSVDRAYPERAPDRTRTSPPRGPYLRPTSPSPLLPLPLPPHPPVMLVSRPGAAASPWFSGGMKPRST
jgi:hypothetical protein